MFIQEEEVIFRFILENRVGDFSSQFIPVVENEGNQKFRLPLSKESEVSYIYQLLEYLSGDNDKYIKVSMRFSDTSDVQEAVKNFNLRIIKPLIDHIIDYLEELKIDMGFDKKYGSQVNFRVKGQVNYADREGTVVAQQNYNDGNVNELIKVMENYFQQLKKEEIPNDKKEETVEFLEAAVEEAQKDKPRKFIVNEAITKVKNMGELAGAGTAIYGLGEQLVQALQGVIV